MTARARSICFGGLFAIATIGYAVQCFTPIRITQDALNYLWLGTSASHGEGFTVKGAPTLSPLGYPGLICLMIKIGLGRSWCLNLLNLLGIGVGLAAVRSMARSRGLSDNQFYTVVLVCLFSFALIKHAAIPMTDVPFFGISLAAIAVAESAAIRTGRDAWVRWTFSLLLMATGFSLRVAGITGLVVVLFEFIKAILRGAGRVRIAAAGLLTLMGIGTLVGLIVWERRPGATTGTPVNQELAVLGRQPLTIVVGRHFLELGQVVLNVPQSKVPGGTPTTVPVGFLLLYAAAGLIVVGAVGLALIRVRGHWTPARTFLICYSFMIFLWPYLPGQGVEPRMWLPVAPLFALELLSNPLPLPAGRILRPALCCYTFCFVAVGIVALSYSVFLTVSRRHFLNLEMIQPWRSEYDVWLLHRPEPLGRVADPQVVSILREFGGNR